MRDNNPFDRKSMGDAYKFYVKECVNDGRKALPWEEYRDLCCDFNMEAQERILDGEKFDMGYRIGAILVRRVERGPRTKPKIDYHRTKKLKKKVYHEDPFYFLIAWEKLNDVKPLKCKRVYSFDPTSTFYKRMWSELRNEDGEFDRLKVMKYPLFKKKQKDGTS